MAQSNRVGGWWLKWDWRRWGRMAVKVLTRKNTALTILQTFVSLNCQHNGRFTWPSGPRSVPRHSRDGFLCSVFTSLSPVKLQNVCNVHLKICFSLEVPPQWGAADAEIKDPSGENTELKRSPFKAWSRSVYSHTCYAYCQGFLSCLFLHFGPFTCIFSKTSPDFSLCWLWLTHGSCVGLQNEIGHPAGCRFPCWVPAEFK